MIVEIPGWHIQRFDDGQEVLLKTAHFDGLQQSFECAYRIAEALAGSEAEQDFTVTADPTAVSIVLHAYLKGPLPSTYNHLAHNIDNIIAKK